MQNQYLEAALQELNLIAKKVQIEFGGLNAEQLNWQPAPDQWSIAQCLDHLIKTNEQYYPLYQKISNGTKQKTIWERLPGLPSFFGKMMLKALDPTNTKKLKAPGVFKPSASAIPTSIVADFVQCQQKLIQAITATDKVDHEKMIVSSPVSGLITYSLQDCVNICVVHEERHYLQAKRVLKSDDFPKNSLSVAH